jgi:hypothetical protein
MLDGARAVRFELGDGVRVEEENPAAVRLYVQRNLVVGDDDRGDDEYLVDDINDEVGDELRGELGKPEVLVDADGERGRDAFAEIVAIEELGEDGPEYAAEDGEHEHRDDYLGECPEVALLLEYGGHRADEDADDAVVERGEVGNAVERVGAEAHDNRGERAAEHAGEDGADGIDEDGDSERNRYLGGDYVDEERDGDKRHGIVQVL